MLSWLKMLFFALTWILIGSGSAFSQSFPYRFKYLTVDEGLSHTDANDIAQDRFGYIWMATFFGLDRYDGYTIKKYYNSNTPLKNAFKNRISCLYPDSAGNIWLSTEDGVQCFNTSTEKYTDLTVSGAGQPNVFSSLLKLPGNRLCGLSGTELKIYKIQGTTLIEQPTGKPSDLKFSSMVMQKDHQLLLSSDKGLWKLNKQGGFDAVHINNPAIGAIDRLYLNQQGQLIICIRNRIFLLKGTTGPSPQHPFIVDKECVFADHVVIRDIVHGRNDYWVNVGNALLRLDNQLKFIQQVDKKGSQTGLNSNSLTKLLVDRSECLWVCTFGGGVNFCDLNQKLFYTLHHDYQAENSLSGNHIRSILENGQELWIGTTANGLNLYDFKTKRFSYFNASKSPIRIKDDGVTALTLDEDRNLWIGTDKGISILSADKSRLLQVPGIDKFPKHGIEALVKDYYGNIWFGNHANRYGVIWKDNRNVYQVNYYDEGEGYFIWADKNRPRVFVSSNHGLKQLEIDHQGNIKKRTIYRASSHSNTLSSDYTYPISSRDGHNYWIGTIGGGVNRLTLSGDGQYQIKSFDHSSGVQYDVESLEIDAKGKIWMGGNGLQCLDPVSGKLTRYDKNDGLQGNSFKVGASYKGKEGRLYFGGINGLNYFYPEQIRRNDISAKPMLTDLTINNQKPRYGDADSIDGALERTISFQQELRLNHLQNNFSIFFSAMHFANPLKCRYRYKLLGFDSDWQFTDGSNPSASYSNLDFKDYKFILQASNNDEVWTGVTAEIAIVMLPPWWKSTWAKTIYLLIFFSGISAVYWFQHKWHRMKTEIEIRAIEENKREEVHQQQKALYQQQMTFFTNVSHEFRTPLTLILGPLESLMSQNTNPALNHSYQLMFRNAKRLINLISELMNFRKVADSIVKLQVQPLAIHDFCQDVAWEFQNMAISKSIQFQQQDYTQEDRSENALGVFDVQILEKILFNLLNNAFKYTNPGGTINFDLSFNLADFQPAFNTGFKILSAEPRAAKYIYFRVSDTGIGISADTITQIFDRYYRISKTHLGSGVGLALVKSLTQLHKGDIYVYSERYKGTEIIIGLPWGNENYQAHEFSRPGAEPHVQLESIDRTMLLPLEEDSMPAPDSSAIRKGRILIVEDNQELRLFLKQALEKRYQVEEAVDGIQGVELASSLIPDLIISDVMMPQMDGIEFCKIMKERFETRHIPFLILSAKDSLETKLEGMESGADHYFAKPLSIDLLLLTIRNIFEQGAKLKQKYTNDYLSEATELVHSEKDKAFFQKLLDVIEQHIQDPSLDVDFLCKHLFVSRTKLYQKIKSTSDQSVSEFIRTVRLKKAIQIMTHEDIAINEVVDRIGFLSSSNFSRAFKKEYGKSPLQFVQGLKKA